MTERNVQNQINLVNYLLKIAHLNSKTVKDITVKREYDLVWFCDTNDIINCKLYDWSNVEQEQNLMEIRHVPSPAIPAIPKTCNKWIASGLAYVSNLSNVEDSPPVFTIIPDVNPTKLDDSKVLIDWQEYVETKWNPWKLKYEEWRKSQDVYEKLYAIYQKLIKSSEQYELVLGIGFLQHKNRENDLVRRHLLTIPVEFNFDADKARLTVIRPEMSEMHLELEVLGEELRKETEDQAKQLIQDDMSLSSINIEKIINSIIHSTFSNGEYKNQLERLKFEEITDTPTVTFSPAVILRNRSTRGIIQALKDIKQQINDGEKVSNIFTTLTDNSEQDKPSYSSDSNGNINEMLFFPKPYNEEQKAIIDKINHFDGVVVQGPPGTGKSHTIANIICHMLATGKRILVTAKTPTALAVLRNLLPKNMRDLAVSVLGNNAIEKKWLESSINQILRKNSEYNEKNVDLKDKQLCETMDALKKEQSKSNRQLRTIIESETYSHSIACSKYFGTATQIAKQVAQEREKYDWFEDEVEFDTEFPFGSDEAFEILTKIRKFGGQREELLLDFEEVMPAKDFCNFVTELKKIQIPKLDETKNEKILLELFGFSEDEIELILENANFLGFYRDNIAKLDNHLIIKENMSLKVQCNFLLNLDKKAEEKILEQIVNYIDEFNSYKTTISEYNEEWIRDKFEKILLGRPLNISHIQKKIEEFIINSNFIEKQEALKEKKQLLDNLNSRILAANEEWALSLLDKNKTMAYLIDPTEKVSKIVSKIEEFADVADSYTLTVSDDILLTQAYNDILMLTERLESGKSISKYNPFIPGAIRSALNTLGKIELNQRRCTTKDLNKIKQIMSFRTGMSEILRMLEHYFPIDNKQPIFVQLDQIKHVNAILADIFEYEDINREIIETEDYLKNAQQKVTRLLEELECNQNAVLSFKRIKLINEQMKVLLNFEEFFDDFFKFVCTNSNLINLISGNELPKFQQACRYLTAVWREKKLQAEILALKNRIKDVALRKNAHSVMRELLNAVINLDTEDYRIKKIKLDNLIENRDEFLPLLEPTKKIVDIIPKTAQKIIDSDEDSIWVTRLKNLEGAWYWSQANNWLSNYINSDNAPKLKIRLKQIEEEIQDVTCQLAELYSWRSCVNRLTQSQKQHMRLWYQALKRLGKGTGKHASTHIKSAQEHLSGCREAIPAWIMPLHRIWDNVKIAPELFDVVIIDEASQAGLEAVPLLYMAKKIIIVGDDKQISPENVGLDQGMSSQLKNEYLKDIGFLRDCFDVSNSLFDIGKTIFSNSSIVLREHFRCMPEIIKFSVDLCYSYSPLIPLKQFGLDRLEPLKHVFLQNGYREGEGQSMTNKPEAEAIVNTIMQMCNDEKYKKKSIGVIVLQGQRQATLIEGELLKNLGEKKIYEHDIKCGTPAQFQGDERDVILLSMVVDSNKSTVAFTKLSSEQKFNVAMSRAREQVILFHSVEPYDLSPSCLRRRLIEFFEKKQQNDIEGIPVEEWEKQYYRADRDVIKPPKPFDSWFELDVALEIAKKGYHIIPQYEVAGKRIDIVVEGNNSKLAVECDGELWHGPDQYEHDLQRQRLLERCSWTFFRIRSSAFYYEKQSTMERLWSVLNDRGIFPKNINSEKISCSGLLNLQ